MLDIYGNNLIPNEFYISVNRRSRTYSLDVLRYITYRGDSIIYNSIGSYYDESDTDFALNPTAIKERSWPKDRVFLIPVDEKMRKQIKQLLNDT